jgi:hypothetical protein
MRLVSSQWCSIYAPVHKPWYLRWVPTAWFPRRYQFIRVIQPGKGAIIYCNPVVYQQILKELMNV